MPVEWQGHNLPLSKGEEFLKRGGRQGQGGRAERATTGRPYGQRGQAPALLSESVCRKAPRKGCLAEFRRPQTAEANQNLSFPGTCASEMTLLMAEGATISQEIESLPPCNPSLKSSRAAFERHRPYRSLILKPMPQTVLMYSVGLALASLARRLDIW